MQTFTTNEIRIISKAIEVLSLNLVGNEHIQETKSFEGIKLTNTLLQELSSKASGLIEIKEDVAPQAGCVFIHRERTLNAKVDEESTYTAKLSDWDAYLRKYESESIALIELIRKSLAHRVDYNETITDIEEDVDEDDIVYI